MSHHNGLPHTITFPFSGIFLYKGFPFRRGPGPLPSALGVRWHGVVEGAELAPLADGLLYIYIYMYREGERYLYTHNISSYVITILLYYSIQLHYTILSYLTSTSRRPGCRPPRCLWVYVYIYIIYMYI